MDSSRLAVGLDTLIRSVADAESAPDIFRALIEGLPLVAPRAAVFLVREQNLKGWHGFGYPAEVLEQLRGYTSHIETPSSRVDPEGGLDLRTGNAPAPGFGQTAPHESATMTIAVKGKPIAMILVERDAGVAPWHPAGLSMAVRVARLRLELSLAERRYRARQPAAQAPAPPTPEPAAPSPETASASAPTPSTVPAPSAAPSAAPAPSATPSMSETPPAAASDANPIESVVEIRTTSDEPRPDPRMDAAKRFARLVATDIRLYNEEAVVLGRRHGDLADRLGEPINLGRQSFTERYGDMGTTGLQLLHQALVEVLAGGDASLLSER